MDTRIIIGLVVTLLFVGTGGYIWKQQSSVQSVQTLPAAIETPSNTVQPNAPAPSVEQATATTAVEHIETPKEEVSTPTAKPSVIPESVATSSKATVDYSGMHIMPDGTVMTKEGKVLTDATVRADGKIVLSDGTVVTPLMDMRSN